MEAIYNNTFLNSLFTSDEFEFIKHLDADNELFDRMSNKQQNYRDLIVQFINSLNDNPVPEEAKNLLPQAQHIFEIINNNISILQLNKEISENINKEVMNLLIKIESNEDNVSEQKYFEEISGLKNAISNYTKKSDEIKNSIISNDNTICNFFDKEIVQKYLKEFSLFPNNEEKNVQDDNSQVTIDEENIDFGDVKENNNCLLVSETSRRVYLPYSKKEVLEYLEKYPDQYKSFENVVKQEFIYPIDFYLKHPVVSRFRETYSLIRDREAKSVLEAFKMAMDMMFHYDLNPTIIAACKSQDQLENYLECLKNKNLSDFKDFEIKFEIVPLKVKK